MSDPVSQLEDVRAQQSFGVLAVRVYQGARSEAKDFREAFWATVAFLVATIAKGQTDDDE